MGRQLPLLTDMYNLTEQFRLYLGVDEMDEVNLYNAELALAEAKAYVEGIVGEDAEELLGDDARLKIAIFMHADSIYSKRDNVDSARNFEALIWQLQLKLKNIRECSTSE